MKKYNYEIAVKNDIKKVINDYLIDEIIKLLNDGKSYDDISGFVYDTLFDYNITGNKTGSYTDRKTALKYLTGNEDLLFEACEEYGCFNNFDRSIDLSDPITQDVLIREYMIDYYYSLADALIETDVFIILETNNDDLLKITYYKNLESAKLKFDALKPAENKEIILFKGNLYIDDEFEQLNNKYYE